MSKKSSNIFDLLRISTNENLHSRFITSIIEYDDNAKREFLKILNQRSINKIDENLLCKARNERKLPNNNGRVDIFISGKTGLHNGNTRIIIENKIFARDQPHQMHKYHKYLKNYDGHLFYLTLERKSPSQYSLFDKNDESIDGHSILGNYSLLSYHDLLPWLTKLDTTIDENVNDTEKANVIRIKSYIKDYIEIVKRLTLISKMIEVGYVEESNISQEDFNALLELRFWQYIEDDLCKGTEPDPKRLYSFEKIQKNHNNSSRNGSIRDYGIVVGDKRIAVTTDSKRECRLYLSKGNFIDDKWVGEKNYLEIDDKSVSTNKLENTSKMIEIAKEIIECFKSLK